MRALLLVLWLCLSLSPAASVAQERAEDPAGLYEEGRALAQARDYDAAALRFGRAYALQPEARYLQAQAMARQAQRHHGVAARLHRRLLRDHPDAPQGVIERSRRQIEALRPELDTVRVVVVQPDEDDRILLDDRSVRVHTDGTLLVDPGPHRFSLERDGQRVAAAELEARAGGSSEVRLEARATAERPPETVVVPPPSRDSAPSLDLAVEDPRPGRGREVWESPWLWVGVAIVVLAGVGIGVGVAVGGEAPYEGTLMPGHLSF